MDTSAPSSPYIPQPHNEKFIGYQTLILFLLLVGEGSVSALSFFLDGSLRTIFIVTIIILLITIGWFIYRLYHAYREDIQKFHQLINIAITLVGDKERLDIILESTQEGMIITNKQGSITFTNRRATEILQIASSFLVNHEVTSFLPIDGLLKPSIQQTKVNLEQIVGRKLIVQIKSLPLVVNESFEGTIILFTDITEEEEFEKMKMDFVSQTAHQLLTPITVLKGNLSLLHTKLSTLGNEDIITQVNHAIAGSDQLLTLTENLLHVSLIERGKLQPNIQPASIEAVIQDAINKQSVSAQQKNVKLVFHNSAMTFPPILIDPYLISEALINVISNAIEYSPQGEEVTIDLQYQAGNIVITITDRGEGISEETASHLFNKFFKGSERLVQRTKGIGLGLYNTKVIVEAHGGTVNVNSILGRGSSFIVTIPMQIANSAHKV